MGNMLKDVPLSEGIHSACRVIDMVSRFTYNPDYGVVNSTEPAKGVGHFDREEY